jgi:membrane peptidoglycan carboxypeptidase
VAQIDGRIHAQGTLKLPSSIASTRVAIDGFAVRGLGTERLQFGTFEFNCRADGGSRLLRTGDGEKAWIAAGKIGPLLPAAVLAAEDQRFAAHAGFDADEIAHALLHTSAAGPTRGASTITQQVARTLFTGADRTGVRKLRELLYAVEMERALGKGRILELYLNTIDWGPGICGARAAAHTYFNKTPAKLTALEAAWLASILRNPHAAYERQFLAGAPSVERAQQVLLQMRTLPRRSREQQSRRTLALAPAPANASLANARFATR